MRGSEAMAATGIGTVLGLGVVARISKQSYGSEFTVLRGIFGQMAAPYIMRLT